MNKTRILAAVCAVLFIAGCATPQESVPALEQARVEVRQAEREQLVQRAAGDRMSQARESLATAERLHADRAPVERVEHHAYLATRNAQIARARAVSLQHEQELARADERRSQLVLRAREAETAQARREAQLAGAQVDAAARALQERDRELQERDRALLERDMMLQAQRAELERMEAQETSRGYVLTLSDVLFATNRAEVQPGASRALGRLAEFLRDNPDQRVIIEGHTDSQGPADYNENLSRARANAVANALQAQGVSRDRIETHGFGESQPIASNDTAAGRQQNRRVEIIIPTERQQARDGRNPPGGRR
jgi:outer membrane protein OmpA-like peptidoglycan-associated protein